MRINHWPCTTPAKIRTQPSKLTFAAAPSPAGNSGSPLTQVYLKYGENGEMRGLEVLQATAEFLKQLRQKRNGFLNFLVGCLSPSYFTVNGLWMTQLLYNAKVVQPAVASGKPIESIVKDSQEMNNWVVPVEQALRDLTQADLLSAELSKDKTREYLIYRLTKAGQKQVGEIAPEFSQAITPYVTMLTGN